VKREKNEERRINKGIFVKKKESERRKISSNFLLSPFLYIFYFHQRKYLKVE
jgi:hypothetical protein